MVEESGQSASPWLSAWNRIPLQWARVHLHTHTHTFNGFTALGEKPNIIIKCIAFVSKWLHSTTLTSKETEMVLFAVEEPVLCLRAELLQRMQLLCLFVPAYQGWINESGASVELVKGRAAGVACGKQQTMESRSD